jgi:hypothetical protein
MGCKNIIFLASINEGLLWTSMVTARNSSLFRIEFHYNLSKILWDTWEVPFMVLCKQGFYGSVGLKIGIFQPFLGGSILH